MRDSNEFSPNIKPCPFKLLTIGLLSLVVMLSAARSADLSAPDGKPVDLSKKVQVFIIMGQSNTLEMGNVGPVEKEGSLLHAVKNKSLYPFLVDAEGNWTVRGDVRQVHVMQKRGNMNVGRNDFFTVKGKKIGIDLGIGQQLGAHLDAPVMVLRSSIGNRSLGWDLLPTGSERFEFKDPKDGKTYVYPGYKDEVRHYSGNAKTYMNVGLAMGEAMVNLLK